MSLISRLLFMALTGCLLAQSVAAQQPAQTAEEKSNQQAAFNQWSDEFDGKALDESKWERFTFEGGGGGKLEVKDGQLHLRSMSRTRAGVRSKQEFTGDRFVVEAQVAKVGRQLPETGDRAGDLGFATLTILFDGSGRNRIEWILTSDGTFEAWSVVDGRGERLDNRKLGTKLKNPVIAIARRGEEFLFILNGPDSPAEAAQVGLTKTIKNMPRSFRVMLYGFGSSENAWDSVRVVTPKQAASHAAGSDINAAAIMEGSLSAATAYTNPVLNADFPDPTVMRSSDGFYYAYATQTITDKGTVNIQVARSKDLIRWEHLGDALPVKPAWANKTQKFWAPHVSQFGNTYYMYYSADPNTLTGLCLAVATSKSPRGPFTDSGKPLKCGESFINIDPMAFDDPRTGKRLLYWGSGFQPIRVQELAPDRLSFLPGSQAVELMSTIKDESAANYQRLIEGAWVTERDGFYYLFYSGDNCCGDKAHYAVMVARSRSATGPFQTLAEARGRPNSVILERNNKWIAPGHNSVIRDSSGQDWIFYHAIDADNRLLKSDIAGDRDVRRIMLMDKLVYEDGWPMVAGRSPSTTPQAGPKTN